LASATFLASAVSSARAMATETHTARVTGCDERSVSELPFSPCFCQPIVLNVPLAA
jgi:hypothetical protein